jgi:hypothetical protein
VYALAYNNSGAINPQKRSPNSPVELKLIARP